jgi:hypothetical protein
MAHCNIVGGYQYFGKTYYYLHLQGINEDGHRMFPQKDW